MQSCADEQNAFNIEIYVEWIIITVFRIMSENWKLLDQFLNSKYLQVNFNVATFHRVEVSQEFLDLQIIPELVTRVKSISLKLLIR